MERRTLIQVSLTALAIGAVGACSSSNTPRPDTTPTLSGPVRIPLADVPVGGGVINTTEEVIVTQATSGEYRAFSAICQHEHCILDAIDDQDIVCPCHGSRYSIVDGSVVRGPTRRPLIEASSATIEGDDLVVVM